MNRIALSITLALILLLTSCSGRSEETGVTAPPMSSDNMPAPSPSSTGAAQRSSDHSAPQPSKYGPGYFVIGLTSREEADAMQEMELRNRAGYQTHVTSSDKWAELAPGWYVVVYGVYDGAAEAAAAAGEFKSRGVNVYVKYSGSLKTGEVLPTPHKGGTQHNEEPTAPPAAPGQEAKVKQLGAGDEDAVNAVRNVWDQHFTKCGDSYLALGSDNILRQLKGVTIDVSQHYPLTEANKREGLEWNGKVSARWNVSRRGTRLSSGWVWEDWKESRQTRVFNVTKKNSRWKVLDVLYDQKKIECSEVPL